MKTILHIDMDAFFASVEQRDCLKLLKIPIGVVGANRRTVVVSPSYKARAFGVKTGMNKYEARKLCPHIKFIKADSEKYITTCQDIIKILYTFSPYIEVYSIDEFFVDITESMHLFGGPLNTARKIKQSIRQKLKLSCSIGIAHNKLLAKLATELKKPDGLFWIRQGDIKSMLKHLPVDSLCGIGPKTKNALSALGVETLEQLRNFDASTLYKIFGEYGRRLHLMAQGIDESCVVPIGNEGQAKSIGHSMTFKKDTASLHMLSKYVLELSDKAARRLRREELCARSVTLTVRYKSFYTFSRQKTLSDPTDSTEGIYKLALAILKSIKLKEPIRLLGVSAGRLTKAPYKTFLFKQDLRRHNINRLLDEMQGRFGKSGLTLASLLNHDEHKRIISPAWRPAGSRRY